MLQNVPCCFTLTFFSVASLIFMNTFQATRSLMVEQSEMRKTVQMLLDKQVFHVLQLCSRIRVQPPPGPLCQV
jgi:hypothetical protein